MSAESLKSIFDVPVREKARKRVETREDARIPVALSERELPALVMETNPAMVINHEAVQPSQTTFVTLHEADSKGKKKHVPKKPGKEAHFDDWVQYYLERMYSRHVSKTETIATIVVGVAAAAAIAYFGIAYWPYIAAVWLPFIVSVVTKKFLGLSFFGAIGSWLKGSIQKLMITLFKKRMDRWAKEAEARKAAKELRKKQKREAASQK